MGINGSASSPEEQDAQELFPHTKMCNERMKHTTFIHGKAVPCSCRASARRKSFLYLIRRVKRQSYVDAYAKIRHQARLRAERARTPAERHAFEEVASWAEELEFGHLDE